MNGQVEHEVCGNCKKEIPQHNYVMHTAHCARNISLCPTCREPIPKNQIETHKSTCLPPKGKEKKPEPLPPTTLERSSYFQDRKSIEDVKVAARRERQIQKYDRLVDSGYSMKRSESSLVSKEPPRNASSSSHTNGAIPKPKDKPPQEQPRSSQQPKPQAKSGLLACKFCDLELPKLELEEHENYCGSRTDKCLECGELVMFKNKQVHMDSNHGFVKLNDEPGPRPSWDSTTQRSASESSLRHRPTPLRSFTGFDSTMYSFPSTYSNPVPQPPKEKGESYKEISRRLDWPAPQPPMRRKNPPTQVDIPCEFCDTPIHHAELIMHETGCRPDLARFNPRRRSPEPDDYFTAPQPTSPDVELPCEFCSDMIPASQLLRHQLTCA